MKKSLITMVFALAVAAQLLVPVSMIWKRETTLREGTIYKFRAAPVDPYDAFRGRFVALRYQEEERDIPVAADLKITSGRKCYAVIENGEDGFARIARVELARPEAVDYIPVLARYTSETNVTIDISYKRFYMEESAAPRAEAAYRDFSQATNVSAYIQLRVRNGFGVIEDLYVDDVPIKEYLSRDRQSAGPD